MAHGRSLPRITELDVHLSCSMGTGTLSFLPNVRGLAKLALSGSVTYTTAELRYLSVLTALQVRPGSKRRQHWCAG